LKDKVVELAAKLDAKSINIFIKTDAIMNKRNRNAANL